jgi:hypothetical protein
MLPEKKYNRLQSLIQCWSISQEDVYYFIENGLLRVCVWLPLRCMERGTVRKNKFIYEKHEHRGGFVGIRPEDFHSICSSGGAQLRIFLSVAEVGHILRMAYEPPQPDVIVRIRDLVILKEDRIKFEKTYSISLNEKVVNQPEKLDFVASNDYRHIVLNGEEYHLGDVQAAIVRQLHNASISRNSWVHGKILLGGTNSRTIKLRDVFKSKAEWQKIIISNGRGYYRLNLPV